MEIKKNPKADLKNKRGLLLEIGLVISLLLVIVAFSYTPEEKRIEKVDLQTAIVEEQIVEITRQDQKPPEPPKKVEVKVIADLLQVCPGYDHDKPEGMALINDSTLGVVNDDDFGIEGYVRIAYCVDKSAIVGSLPYFKALAQEYGL